MQGRRTFVRSSPILTLEGCLQRLIAHGRFDLALASLFVLLGLAIPAFGTTG